MLRQKLALVLMLCLSFALMSMRVAHASEVKYIALNYHDVKDQLDAKDDRSTVSTDALVLHFNWLQKRGYTTIDLDDVLAARDGVRPLPAKAVMLTFDDGYASFYTRVYPLLKSFKFKAVQAVVGRWINQGKCDQQGTSHDGCTVVGVPLMTWDQLREIKSSGLVEIASHSYDLHHGISADPQGDKLPAATALEFDASTKLYEASDHYHERIRADLMRNNALIKEHLGVTPRIMVWPYGSHHSESIAIAQEAGMLYNMLLGDALNTPAGPEKILRYLMLNSTDMEEFAAMMEGRPNPHRRSHDQTIRVMHVDLDYLYDANPVQQQRNLDSLIERVARMGANTVYLQAFSDTDGDGAADALYFPNRYLPMRADLFTHVAWRLRTRFLHVKVYAWMPVMAFHMPEKYNVPLVEAVSPDKKGAYHRLSPFDEGARRIVKELYEDVSMHARFDGIIFHDDATFNDFEDTSVSALKEYKRWGLDGSVTEIRADPVKRIQWSKHKTEYLNQWTLELAAAAQRFQETGLLTARNIYALPVLNPDAEEWFAQSLESFLKTYNYTAIMAMPYMEEVPLKEHEAWLIRLAKRVASIPGALNRTVFELQAVDWKAKQPVPDDVLAKQMFVLHQNSVVNLGYYPDDFPANRPDVGVLRRYFAWEE